jgi:hypothetical protein
MIVFDFLDSLRVRNTVLYYFGWANFLGIVLCSIHIYYSSRKVLGINAYIKPLKFFISTLIFVWSMAWFLSSLRLENQVGIYSWMVIAVFSFENIYIYIQAARGETSHFNLSTGFHSTMFMLMGLAIVIMTLWTGYMDYLFYRYPPAVAPSYLWGIRIGILFFVIFAFQGGIMGSRLSHTVGNKDGGEGLPIVNWSTQHGDLRIAHFLGMHSLQILPIISFYWVKNVSMVLFISLVYFILVSYFLFQALRGKPLLKLKT